MADFFCYDYFTMKAVVVFLSFLFGVLAGNSESHVNGGSANVVISWEQGAVFAVDRTQKDVIVLLPVLFPRIEDCAGTYLDVRNDSKGFCGFAIGAIVREKGTDEYVSVVVPFDEKKQKLYDQAKRDFYSKQQCLHYDFISEGYSRAEIFPPYLGFANKAYILSSPRPVRQLRVIDPSEQSSLKILLVTREARKGKIAVCYADNKGTGFGLVDPKTGILEPIVQDATIQFDDFWEEGVWLNDHQIAWCGAGRHLKKWLILDIGLRKILATGEKEDTGHGFCVKDGSLYTEEVGDKVELIPLWLPVNK